MQATISSNPDSTQTAAAKTLRIDIKIREYVDQGDQCVTLFAFQQALCCGQPLWQGLFQAEPEFSALQYLAGQVTHAHAERYSLHLSELF